jgi:perosamine synthetase
MSDPHLIPLCAPEIRGNEWKYVKECLDTGWVSSVGSFVGRFERELATHVGTRAAVATSSGTAALHVALLVAGVEPNDEVLVSTLSFIAPANAVRYVGAWPVFTDADPTYWQMDIGKVRDFIEKECRWVDGALWNKTTQRRLRALLPVHILGHPVDMDPLMELARKYGLAVVEDATESLGAAYRERPVGRLGDIACFSFNGNKIVTTGGGGMIVTDREDWARRARYLTTQAKDDPVEFIHGAIGFNYRLSNVQAAVGCAQMERLTEYVVAKRTIATRYAEGLHHTAGLASMKEAPWAFSTFWMSTIIVDEAVYGLDSRSLMSLLRESGIESRPLWRPLHLNPVYRDSQAHLCEVAPRLARHVLSLPSSVGLAPADQDRVIERICSAAPSPARRGEDGATTPLSARRR